MIIQNILEVCVNGACKTKIVYRSNLNFTTVNSYMAKLIDNGLLEVEQGGSIEYKTTKKGIDLMKGLKQHHDEIFRLSSMLAHAFLMISCLFSISVEIILHPNFAIYMWYVI